MSAALLFLYFLVDLYREFFGFVHGTNISAMSCEKCALLSPLNAARAFRNSESFVFCLLHSALFSFGFMGYA